MVSGGAKKKIRRGISFIILVVILLVAASFIFGIRVSFVINDELDVKLNPMDISLNVANDEIPRVKFEIKNMNFIQCKAKCDFKLVDLRDNSILESSSLTLEHNQEIIKRFTLPVQGIGHGQALYNFEVACNNIKTVICPTEEARRWKTALITVNYDLTKEQEEAKERLSERIQKGLEILGNATRIMEQNKALLDDIPLSIKEKHTIGNELNQVEIEVEDFEADKQRVLNLWSSEEYLTLDRVFSEEAFESIRSTEKNLISLQEDLIGLAGLRDQNIDLLNEVEALNDNLLDATNYYMQEKNPNNGLKLSDIDAIAESILESYLSIKSNQKNSEKEINEKLAKDVDDLKEKLNIYKENKFLGLGLLIYGEALLDIKEGAAIEGLNYDFSCSELKDIVTRVNTANDKSNSFRELNYNYTIGDASFERTLGRVRNEIELAALEKTKKHVNKSSIAGKELLLELIDEEILVIGQTAYSSSIPKEHLYDMVLLNNSRNGLYLENFCSIAGAEQALPFNTYSLLGEDLSSLESKRIVLNIPIVEVNISALPDTPAMCCVFGECMPCCDETCSNDENRFPVIFIHGHTVSKLNTPESAMNDFSMMQKKMEEKGFVNAGELDITINPYEVVQGEWGKNGNPISLRTSYYYIAHYDVAGRTMSIEKTDKIENYAIRLREIIKLIKYRTGATKVNIVAHSMGGLVVREYLDLFGTSEINKVITVNTPHKGISGKVKALCSIIGASKECDDMKEGSIFLSRLNSKELPADIEFHAIRSIGCRMDKGQDGDGIVTEYSSQLDGAENYVIEGKCNDALQTDLHTNVLSPHIYPETYELIVDILNS